MLAAGMHFFGSGLRACMPWSGWPGPDPASLPHLCSDGFMVGALEVGLRFCRPFLDKPDKKQGALQVGAAVVGQPICGHRGARGEACSAIACRPNLCCCSAILSCALPLLCTQHLEPTFYLGQRHRLAGGSRERSLAGGLGGCGTYVHIQERVGTLAGDTCASGGCGLMSDWNHAGAAALPRGGAQTHASLCPQV